MYSNSRKMLQGTLFLSHVERGVETKPGSKYRKYSYRRFSLIVTLFTDCLRSNNNYRQSIKMTTVIFGTIQLCPFENSLLLILIEKLDYATENTCGEV